MAMMMVMVAMMRTASYGDDDDDRSIGAVDNGSVPTWLQRRKNASESIGIDDEEEQNRSQANKTSYALSHNVGAPSTDDPSSLLAHCSN